VSADFLCQTATLPLLVNADGGPTFLEFTNHAVNFGPGQGVHVPPNLEHRFCNRSTEDVVFLVISIAIGAKVQHAGYPFLSLSRARVTGQSGVGELLKKRKGAIKVAGYWRALFEHV
jgi:hypothetical protein